MLLLEERITNHDTYKKIEKIIQLLETLIESEFSSEQVSIIERLSETLIILKDALDRVDPWLLSSNTLQNMNNPITRILNDLTNFNNINNVTYLNNANNHLDEVIVYFPQVMVTKTPDEIEGIREAVISFRKSIGQHLANVEKYTNETSEALEKNKNKLNELTDSIETQKSRTDNIISNFQDQFLKGQTERNEKLEKLIEQSKKEFEYFISLSEETFNEQMNKQEEENDSQMNKNKKEFEEQMSKLENIFIEEHKKIVAMNKEAEKILGIMSMKGLAQGYQKIANDEGKKALGWHIVSIISMLGVIGLAIGFILMHEGTMTWTDLVSRAVITGIGITLFTYCAKQATNHREEERRNRKIELELASLDPYLKDMDEEQQKEVKQNLVNKYFGVEFPSISGKQPKLEQEIIETITSNPQFIQKLVEQVNRTIQNQNK